MLETDEAVRRDFFPSDFHSLRFQENEFLT